MDNKMMKAFRLRYLLPAVTLIGFFYHQNQDNYILENVVYELIEIYSKVTLSFSAIDDATNRLTGLLPLIGVILFIVFVFLFSPPMPNWLRMLVITVTFFLHTIYIIFRSTILNLNNPLNATASIVFFSTEIFHYMMMCCFYLQMVWGVDRSLLADRGERLIRTGQYDPSVAFFVPTLNEPVEVLRRTLIGCLAVDYRRKNIYLLDDGSRKEMRLLARELGCSYISRSNRKGAKAGNINHALEQTNEELIAFLDCDNIPAKNFLNRMVGLFFDPQVAMTISSLHYYNAQEPKKIIGVEMLTATDHAKSLGCNETGRDSFNAILCFGTSYIVRRSALEAIGGIPAETLCEDWATSIRLQNKRFGYKTHFINEILSTGLAAENMSGFVRQRLRWCQGTIQALFSSTNPLTAEGLNCLQRLIHCFGILYYLMYPAIFISWLVPLFYFFFGIVPVEANVQQFSFFFFPYFIMMNTMYITFSRRLSALISSQIHDYIMCWPFTLTAIKSLFVPFGKRFDVTPKGIRSDNVKPILLLSLPLIIFFMLYLSGVIYGYQNIQWLSADGPFAVYALWAVYRMVFFWLAFNASVNLPQQRRSVRFSHGLNCELYSLEGDFLSKAHIEDLSETGAKIWIERDHLPTLFKLSIPQLSLESIESRTIRASRTDGVIGIEFLDCSLAGKRRLVEFLYCEPGRWDKFYLPEKTAFRALLNFSTQWFKLQLLKALRHPFKGRTARSSNRG
jgi:cellulose synthase (UDP-forming)